MKYKIIDTTVEYLGGVEFDYDFSEVNTGNDIAIFGMNLKVNQTGSVFGMASKDSILVCQEVAN